VASPASRVGCVIFSAMVIGHFWSVVRGISVLGRKVTKHGRFGSTHLSNIFDHLTTVFELCEGVRIVLGPSTNRLQPKGHLQGIMMTSVILGWPHLRSIDSKGTSLVVID